MQPGRQWKDRIEIWLRAIKEQVYKPLGETQAKGFFTMEELSAQEACKHVYNFVKTGADWGQKWEYAWFQFQISLPKEAEGKRIVCVPDVGGESLCYVKNQEQGTYLPRGAYDKQHKEILLTRQAKAGEVFDLMMEAYAGHGPRHESAGPFPPEIIPVQEPPKTQCKMGHITYGIWQEEAYQLYLDAYVLWDLYQVLDSKSLRAMEILEGLQTFTKIADVELEGQERIDSFVKAREVLQPLLACQNGSTAPLMSICGQSHLDLAWLWPYAETRRKTARTYSNQLTLMEEYPEYQFFSCDPFVLEVLQEKYPEVYAQYLMRVSKGQMHPEGATYVEPDLNMICGEALIRHIKEGVLRFRRLTKLEHSKLLWLPDVFGFTAALPQVMKLCGVPYFATQKLERADPETEPFPYNDFIWEGLDGSRVLAHIFMKNNTQICPQDIYTRWYTHRHQETGMDGMLYPFGFGDGGGGPTRDMVEIARRVENLEGIPKTKMENPVSYFTRMEQNKYKKPVYRGELYLAWHRGTYTAQSLIKRGNRLAETALNEAEALTAFAQVGLVGVHLPKSTLATIKANIHTAWEQLMFLQFHDILPGSSIQRVNEEAVHTFQSILWETGNMKQMLCESRQSQSKQQKASQTQIMVQTSKEQVIVTNQKIRAVFAADGTLVSLRLKGKDREYLSQPGNTIHLYKNVNAYYDAWEIGRMVYDEEILLEQTMIEPLKIAYREEVDGDIVRESVVLSYAKQINQSVLRQDIVIGEDSTCIHFETQLDWQERHKLCKVGFYPKVHTREGIEEIQYGYLTRSFGENHQHEIDQYEVVNHRYSALADDNHGLAVLNDCKYGVHVTQQEIALSLMRASLLPDMSADHGIHHMTYTCMIWEGAFSDARVTEEAIRLQHISLQQEYERQKIAQGRQTFTLLDYFDMGNTHMIPDWFTFAEASEKMVLLRVYEAMNMEETGKITIPFSVKKAVYLSVYEEELEEIAVEGAAQNEITITCKPFEVKTIGLYYV